MMESIVTVGCCLLMAPLIKGFDKNGAVRHSTPTHIRTEIYLPSPRSLPLSR